MGGPYNAADSASSGIATWQKAQDELSSSRHAYFKELLVYREVVELLTVVDEDPSIPTNEVIEEGARRKSGLLSSAEKYETLCDLARAQATERVQIQLPFKETEPFLEIQRKYHRSKDDNEKDNRESESRGSEKFSGSGTHFLGVRPEDIQAGRGVQEDFIAEVYSRLCLKHQRLSEIVEPTTTSTIEPEVKNDSENLSLVERARAASRRRDTKEQNLKKGEESMTQLYEKYEQEQAQNLMLSVEIVEQYKLQQRQKYERLRMELLCEKTVGFEKELRDIKKGVREQTYTNETMPALRIVRKHLDAQIQELSTALAKGKLRVLEYEQLGYEFADLARRYKEALTHLEMQKSIYEDLVHDTETETETESVRESIGYSEKWDEVSTTESGNY